MIANQPTYRPYIIQVKALNEQGDSNVPVKIFRGFSGQGSKCWFITQKELPVNSVKIAAPTQPVSDFTVVQMDSPQSVVLSWKAVTPESLNGKFEGYKIQTWTDDDEAGVRRTVEINHDIKQAVVHTLMPYAKNYVRICAYNSYHDGPSSATLEVITDEWTPGPVYDLQVKPAGRTKTQIKKVDLESTFWEERKEERNTIVKA